MKAAELFVRSLENEDVEYRREKQMRHFSGITNLVGNGLATIAMAKWEGAFDAARWNEATGDKARGSGVSAKWVAKRLSLVGADECDLPAGQPPVRAA